MPLKFVVHKTIGPFESFQIKIGEIKNLIFSGRSKEHIFPFNYKERKSRL